MTPNLRRAICPLCRNPADLPHDIASDGVLRFPTLAAGSDILYGMKAISAFLGISNGAARSLVEAGLLPTFRLPGRTTRCATKSSINSVWRAHEQRYRERRSNVNTEDAKK